MEEGPETQLPCTNGFEYLSTDNRYPTSDMNGATRVAGVVHSSVYLKAVLAPQVSSPTQRSCDVLLNSDKSAVANQHVTTHATLSQAGIHEKVFNHWQFHPLRLSATFTVKDFGKSSCCCALRHLRRSTSVRSSMRRQHRTTPLLTSRTQVWPVTLTARPRL